MHSDINHIYPFMNSFGKAFQIKISGTSHAKKIEIEINGCPSNISVDQNLFLSDLQRRKPTQAGSTKRLEEDIPEILSGIEAGKTTGEKITIQFQNKNIDASVYEQFYNIPRPSHADFTAMKKYGETVDLYGGGIFSGRMTVALVAAGVIAKQILKPAIIAAELTEVGGRKNIQQAVLEAIEKKDSLGGRIHCSVKNLPVGLGEPFFDGLESTISHIVFSVPGVKGIEFGSGFEASKMFGSGHNDCFINEKGTTKTNFSGGINGGISNGNELYFDVAVKPTPSIELPQQTFNFSTKEMDILEIKGRHDVCFALRVPVVIEAVTAISLADAFLCNSIHQKTI